MNAPIKIVILGGGTSGWMCAAHLGQLVRTGKFTVTVVESDEIGTVGVGEATLPHLKTFNDNLGIDEAEFMRRTQATFKLGIEFRDWGPKNEKNSGGSYIHPFGAYGAAWGGVEFHQHWLRAKRSGVTVAPLEAYNFAITAARAGKFDFPTSDAHSVKSTYAYAYHFDAALYAAFMRDFAMARGVTRREGRVVDVALDALTSDIRSLNLRSGESIDGDLFIDCSGFAALLIDKALKVGWEDWTPWLPCDHAWAVPTSLRSDAAERSLNARIFTKDSQSDEIGLGGALPRMGPGARARLPDAEASGASADLIPYTRSIARQAGWQWRIPLQHRTGNGYVFASAFVREDQALDALLAHLEGPPLADPKLLRFKAGRRLHTWHKNCVAIGLASGFLEPLESTSIYLVQVAVTRLLSLLSAAPADERLAREFNREIDVEYERVRDFLILHYHANTRDEDLCGTPAPWPCPTVCAIRWSCSANAAISSSTATACSRRPVGWRSITAKGLPPKVTIRWPIRFRWRRWPTNWPIWRGASTSMSPPCRTTPRALPPSAARRP